MTGIHHLALRVSDCIASARFYAEAFDLREVRRVHDQGGVRAIWLRAGDAVLMLEQAIRGAGRADGSGHVLIFATSDVEASGRRLRDLGIPITDRTVNTLYVEDPDGHRAGVSSFPFAFPFPLDEGGC